MTHTVLTLVVSQGHSQGDHCLYAARSPPICKLLGWVWVAVWVGGCVGLEGFGVWVALRWGVGGWVCGGLGCLRWVGTETLFTWVSPFHPGPTWGVWVGLRWEGWVGTETHPGPTWHRVKEVHLVYSLAMFVEGCDVKAIAMTLT